MLTGTPCPLQTQTVQEMLEKLGCGLQETELWALCKECVQALTRYRYDLRKLTLFSCIRFGEDPDF